MTALWSIVIPALCGLLTGVIGSLVAPWVHWRIELKRERLQHRRGLVAQCRAKVGGVGFQPKEFWGTPEYAMIEPYLTENERRYFTKLNVLLCGPNPGDGVTQYRRLLLKAIEKMEEDWGLN